MPAAEDSVTFRSAIGARVRALRTFFVSSAGSEVAAVLVMLMLVALVAGLLALFADPPVTANGQAPTNPCIGQITANSTTEMANQVKVSDVTGSGDTLDLYTDRNGDLVERVSAPLSVQNGLLPPNVCLGTVVSDLVRPDGQAIPSNQVTSWAMSGNAGLRIFIYVEVSPHYASVTQSGGYTGTVSLDDERATGGNIPVTVHVEYPRLWHATMACIVAAWVGFFWAWLIHLTRADIPTAGRFWLYITLQLAVLTIVAFPVLNAQVLTNPDWEGDMSQYIALASLAGAGALATTPTLRALIDRAAIFMPGSTESLAAGGQLAPVVPSGPPAGSLAGADGGAPTAPLGNDGEALTAPQGGDGSALPAPPGGTGGDGGALTAPTGTQDGAGGTVPSPQGGDGSALPAPQGGDTAALTAPPVPPAPAVPPEQ